MFAVLKDLSAAGAALDVAMVRTLRERFHVRFDAHAHRTRLDAARPRFAKPVIQTAVAMLARGCPIKELRTCPPGARDYWVDEFIAAEQTHRSPCR